MQRAQPACIQEDGNHVEQTRYRRRLPQQDIPRRLNRIRSRSRCQHDNGNPGRGGVGPHPPAQFSAIDPGHHPVRHDEVGARERRDRHGGLAVLRGQYIVPFGFQYDPQWPEDFHVVINQENRRHLRDVQTEGFNPQSLANLIPGNRNRRAAHATHRRQANVVILMNSASDMAAMRWLKQRGRRH